MASLRTIGSVIAGALVATLAQVAGAPATAQEAPASPPSIETLTSQANEERQLRSKKAMGVLLGWSALNIGVGTVGYLTTDGSTRYFHQMNAAWNLVNAAIAGVGLLQNRRTDHREWTPLKTMEEDYRLQKILLLNMGLNVAYMAGGAYLWERGLRTDDERLQGYGPALLVQGGFLLLFDSTFFWLQNRGARDYRHQLRLHWNDGPTLSYQARF